MTIHDVYAIFQNHFRPRRMRDFAERLAVRPETRVLDVGGSAVNWRYLEKDRPDLTIGNIYEVEGVKDEYRFLVFDGADMPFGDEAFDIVYSNSAIEHVGDWEKIKKFATEIRRVGKKYYVQTPNKWFFFEPHFLCFFIHWLPRPVYYRMMPFLSAWMWIERPDERKRRHHFDEIDLLDEKKMREIFPDAAIHRERFLFFTKSLIAVRE